MDMLDIYTDYLICQNKHATETGLSEMLEGDIAHDKVTRFLRLNKFDSKSPTKTITTQCNHVFAAIIAYCKLEFLKFKTKMNHFAIK